MDRIVVRRKSWRNVWPYAAAGVFLIVGIWILSGLGSTTYRVSEDKLTIGTVVRGPFEDYAAVRSSVAPYATVYLTTDQGGTVKKVLVEDGSTVREGQPLILLANPTLQLQYATSQLTNAQQTAEVQNTELQLEQTRFQNQKELLNIDYQIKSLKAEIERDQRLFDAGALARATYEKDMENYKYQIRLQAATKVSFATSDRIRKRQLAQLKETQLQLKASLEAARQSIDALTVCAPMDGQLTALDAEPGQSKAAGAVLGQVDTQNRFKLTAQVDEFYLSRVQMGQFALMTISGRSYKARVRKIYPQVTDGTFKVDLLFDGDAPEGVHTGQAVDLKLELGGAETALLLPAGAFYQDTGGAWVFVLAKGGDTATRRTVRLGRRNPDYIEILDGLVPGDRVIVSAYTAYKTVDKVRITSGHSS